MTLRDDIRGLFTEPGGDAALLGDVPSDLVSTLLAHFADTAPIEQADALAPMVMQASPVPFDEELDGVGSTPVSDPLSELSMLLPVAAGVDAIDHETDSLDWDPDELDAAAESETGDHEANDDAGVSEQVDATDDADFGSGFAQQGEQATKTADVEVDAEADAGSGGLEYVEVDADPMDFDALDLANDDTLLEPVDELESGDQEDDFDDMFD